ncbi:MAG TPA: IS200/IS605 family transposase [Cyanobacteria bacterium UBA8803]|nr:IS200/IS605 family transposase [Cyanobacteria bacterium UBA9273]HBL58311.1 IS200/IS605 family transposase [Cyanobacteria bacterium UBA8803]
MAKLSKEDYEYRRTDNSVSSINYHFVINAPTHESPADIARWVKGRASHHLRKEFPELKKLPALWTPTYFVATTGQVSTEVVKKYIENQRGK